MACRSRQLELVQLLLSYPAVAGQLDVRDALGNTPTLCAARADSIPIVRMLVAAWADPAATNARNEGVLLLAAEHNNVPGYENAIEWGELEFARRRRQLGDTIATATGGGGGGRGGWLPPGLTLLVVDFVVGPGPVPRHTATLAVSSLD